VDDHAKDDKALLDRISQLVGEERTLRERHVGTALSEEERARLEHVEHELDRSWDLLRRRRAREERGQDPDVEAVRPESQVEGYLQ